MGKRYKNLLTAVGCVSLIALTAINPSTALANEAAGASVRVASLPDVGHGIEWPAQVNAPFVDMGDWVAWGTAYSNNGAPNVGMMAENSGARFFKLGFIQATPDMQIVDGRVSWGWGGHQTLSHINPSDQYRGIRQSIRDVREMGGDVAVSLGGLDGITFWEVTQDIDILANTYRELINEYGLTRLDLDIEVGNQFWGSLELSSNVANAQALRQVQEETGIEIVLTLPALPTGLVSGRGLEMLEIYLSNGVDISMVNIMTMYFGLGTILPGESYAQASIRSAQATKEQVQYAWRMHASVELTDAEAFMKVGVTPSIGFMNTGEYFNLDDAQELVDFAIENRLGMVSFWAVNRDSMIGWDSNHLTRHLGIASPYQFSSIFNGFMENSETPGVPPAPEVPVPPTPAPEVPVPPTPAPDASSNTFNPNQVYLAGDVVTYNGNTYRARWWTQGESPTTSVVWELMTAPGENGVVDFRLASVYLAGDIVRFEGNLYRARWWTQGENPTTSEVWEPIR